MDLQHPVNISRGHPKTRLTWFLPFFDKVPAYLNKYRWLTFLKNFLYFYEVEFKLDDHLAGKQSKICNFNCSSVFL